MKDNIGHQFIHNYHQVKIWFKLKKFFFEFLVPENENLFDTINESLLVLCLDDTYQKTNKKNAETLVGLNFLHGGGTKYNTANRWFDKTLQVNWFHMILSKK